MSPEAKIRKQVAALFRSVGATVLATSQSRPSRVAKGLPDFVILLPRGKGCMLFEAKTPEGRLSTDQVVIQDQCRFSKVPYVVGGVPEAQSFLSDAGLLIDLMRELKRSLAREVV